MDIASDPTRRRRLGIYLLLIVISLSQIAARIMSVRSASGSTPFLSANDRSRWATVRSLVEHHTFELDDVIFKDGKRDKDWYSIDLVRHRGHDGSEHFYSSKPPLLTVVMAAEYWVLRQITGASLSRQPLFVGRIMLLLSNVVPLAFAWLILALLVDRLGASDVSRVLVMAAACFATLVTPFAVTLNNHLPAVVATILVAFAILEILRRPRVADSVGRWYLLAGCSVGILATNELPALCVVATLFLVLARRNLRATLIWYLPPAAVLLLSLLLLNYVAHGSWRPAYAHRGDGAQLGEVSLPAPLESGVLPEPARQKLLEARFLNVDLSADTSLQPLSEQRWMLWDPQTQTRLALRPDSSGVRVAVHDWDDWYRYEGTYWVPERLSGVDRGEPSLGRYVLHILIGHHGIFSLTPIWIFSLWGAVYWVRRGEGGIRVFAAIVVITTLVCLVFYTAGRPTIDRNYGGVNCGFRWMIWFIPWWLLLMLPALDRVAGLGNITLRRILFSLAIACIAVSAFSAAYPAANPWTHPWFYQYWQQLGWIAG